MAIKAILTPCTRQEFGIICDSGMEDWFIINMKTLFIDTMSLYDIYHVVRISVLVSDSMMSIKKNCGHCKNTSDCDNIFGDTDCIPKTAILGGI